MFPGDASIEELLIIGDDEIVEAFELSPSRENLLRFRFVFSLASRVLSYVGSKNLALSDNQVELSGQQ